MKSQEIAAVQTQAAKVPNGSVWIKTDQGVSGILINLDNRRSNPTRRSTWYAVIRTSNGTTIDIAVRSVTSAVVRTIGGLR